MKYQVTFKSMIGLTVGLSLIGIMTISLGILAKDPSFAMIGAVLLSVLATIRIRYKVTSDGEYLTSTDILSTKKLKWSEITQIIRSVDCGYPKNRFYGPFAYEFRTTTDCLKINFKLFPLECMTEILKRAKEADHVISSHGDLPRSSRRGRS